ncbi:hypothetical protein AB1Y20_010249 [Prymnesium parvum]|uniref:ATP-dependent DNA helicase n=1 Tax=Prymnesium parvum TaxID=97485 RepID=A0AB34K6L7_PRYPA
MHLECTVTLQQVCARGGHAVRTTTFKQSVIAYCIDESDRRVLRVGRDRNAQEFPVLGGVQLMTQFVRNGKATLILLKRSINLLLSDADPTALQQFCSALKTGGQPRQQVELVVEGVPKRSIDSLPTGSSTSHDVVRAVGVHSSMPLASLPPSQMNSPSSRAPGKKARDQGRPSPTWRTPPRANRNLRSEEFTQEQKAVMRAACDGHSIFFTGGAGVGKTFLLREIVEHLPSSSTFVTASTGMAACQAGGVTIHHWAGIGGGDRPIDELVAMAIRKRGMQWRSAKCLVIDEVSMLDGALFDKLEEIARRVRNNSSPFGGLQLVLCGDFFQLPPVARDGNFKFAFEAHSWPRCVERTFELTQIFRQSEHAFIDALRQIRLGRAPASARALLQQCENRELDNDDGIVATRLFTHKDDCDTMNKKKLKELDGPQITFTARDTSQTDGALATLRSGCTAPVELTLKVGAQVVLIKTLDVKEGLVNGARGVVVKLLSTKNPVVRFTGGAEITVRMEAFPLSQGGQVVACRHQLPLAHAWAISIHRSQGMSLDRVEMSLARVFECGQMYVALSRARSLAGLSIRDVNWAKLRAHPKVLAWHEQMANRGHVLRV